MRETGWHCRKRVECMQTTRSDFRVAVPVLQVHAYAREHMEKAFSTSAVTVLGKVFSKSSVCARGLKGTLAAPILFSVYLHSN
jgi:hypothetical protein